MTYATNQDLLEVESTINDFGIPSWTTELASAETEVNRILRVKWWPTFRQKNGVTTDLDPTKLDPTQLTKATVYYALAYLICTKLTQFSPDDDRFGIMMKYYAGRLDHEMDLVIREGVRYDLDANNTISSTEHNPVIDLRLVR